MTRVRPSRFVILTGLSGAGKSNAIHALEDQGYYCVDNLPVSMLTGMAAFARERQSQGLRVAVVVDVVRAAVARASSRLSACSLWVTTVAVSS